MKRSLAFFLVALFVLSSASATIVPERSTQTYGAEDDETSGDLYSPSLSDGWSGIFGDYGAYTVVSEPDSNGFVSESKVFGDDFIPIFSNGSYAMGQADNSWTSISGNWDSGSKGLVRAKIPQSSSSVKADLDYNYYDYRPGQKDLIGSAVDISFNGMANGKILPADLAEQANYVHTFETGSEAECAASEGCYTNGWTQVLPLCAEADCSNKDKAAILTAHNGIDGMNTFTWSIVSNQTSEYLIFDVGIDPSFTNAEFKVRSHSNEPWVEMNDNDVLSGGFFEYQIKPNETTQLIQSTVPAIEVVHQRNESASLNISDYHGETYYAPGDYSIWRKGNNLVISAGLLQDWVDEQPSGFEENITQISFDPMISFGEEDQNWVVGVDRDGGAVYGYGCTASTQNCAWYNAPTLGTGGTSANFGGTFGYFDVGGDGWCKSSGNKGNAICRMQGIKTFWRGNYDPTTAEQASLPLFDSTKDFDGVIQKVSVPVSEWRTSTNAPFTSMAIEVGLQTVAYGPTISSWSDPTTWDSWLGTNGGWYEQCFNGYIDVFAVPIDMLEGWEGEARYSAEYRPDKASVMGDYYDHDGNSLTPDIQSPLYYATNAEGNYLQTTQKGFYIGGDGDKWSGQEYYYKKSGDKTMELRNFVSGQNEDVWKGVLDTSNVRTYNRGITHTMDDSDSAYWAYPYDTVYGGDITSAQMKVNPFHYSQTGNNVVLYSDMFEGGSAGNDNSAPGANDDMDGTYDSTFNHIHDYWDVNFYDDATYPNGVFGAYAPRSYDSAGNWIGGTGLAEFHVKTQRLGTATSDFCYDPITGNPSARTDNSAVAIEPKQNLHIEGVEEGGSSYLNLDIPIVNDRLYDSHLAATTYMSQTELIQHGYLSDANDDTVEFALIIDVRGNSQTQSMHCWVDPTQWVNNHQELSAPGWAQWGSSFGKMRTLSTNWMQSWCGNPDSGLFGIGAPSISFSDFIDETPCVSDKPNAGQNTGQNPHQAFWCGLSLISPFSTEPMIRIKGETTPYIPPTDTDADGVPDTDDDCPGTDPNVEVDDRGCEEADAPTNPPTPNPQWNDYDLDGVPDNRDKCDLKGPADGARFAEDYANYTVDRWRLWQANRLTYAIDNDGCPYARNASPAPPGPQPTPDPSWDCATSGQEDLGTYIWEDNDLDGLIDEDWFDNIDNDGDGLVDEDPFDDCPNDGIDRLADFTFSGSLELTLSAFIDGAYRPTEGDALPAENGTSEKELYDASVEEYEKLLIPNSFIAHDTYRENLLTCNYLGNANTVFMRMELFAWVPADRVSPDAEGFNVKQPLFGSEARTPGDPTENPNSGYWVPYGPISLPGGTSSYSGWADIDLDQQMVRSSTSNPTGRGILTESINLEPHLAEGYYMLVCNAYEKQTVSGGSQQSYYPKAVMEYQFQAVETCSDGTMPSPPSPFVAECLTSNGGGGTVESQTSDFFDTLLDGLYYLGLFVLGLAVALLAWFLGRKTISIGTGMVSAGIVALLVSIEGGLTGFIPTTAYGLILIGGYFVFWNNRLFDDEEDEDYTGMEVIGGTLLTAFFGFATLDAWLDFGYDLPGMPLVLGITALVVFAQTVMIALVKYSVIDEDDAPVSISYF
jgi:hypothetical protein